MTHNETVDMVTACDNVVNYGNPSLTYVDPEDLRIHTRNICRYNGALNWKLVQHLDLCGQLAHAYTRAQRFDKTQDKYRKTQAAYAVAHDFHEIYCTDVVSGMKKYLPAYRKIEADWEAYVHDTLGMSLAHKDEEFIRKVDVRALVIEMTELGHPAAKKVAKQFGGPVTDEEHKCFRSVITKTLDQNWERVWRIFTLGRRALSETEDTVDRKMNLF